MKEQERRNALLEATNGIREMYIEEAAMPAKRTKPVWTRWVAAAAALALLIGLGTWLWPDREQGREYLPVFAIRAFAADGGFATLTTTGDTSELKMMSSDLFPGKQVYMLDISLTDAQGNRLDLEGSEFRCLHRGKNLQPGKSDEFLSIQWLDEDGFYGYRLTGWCDAHDYIDITIYSDDGLILHQKELRIRFAEEYTTEIKYSYTYEAGLTTEELMAKIFDADYDHWKKFFIGNPRTNYHSIKRSYGGFQALERREDAASLLLQRWIAEMEAYLQENQEKPASVEESGVYGMVLSQDVHWNNLTEEELALIESYGIPRRTWKEEDFYPFPGKKKFDYDIIVDGPYYSRHNLEIFWPGKTEESFQEHIRISFILSAAWVEEPFHGWGITGWFDEPTELTLTVTDENGDLLRRDVILVTPTEDGYQIDLVDQTI